MISRRTVTLLGTVTVLAVIGAGLSIVDRAADTRTTVTSEVAFPDLKEAAQSVDRVRLTRYDADGDGVVTLVKSETGWVVEERDGYPALTEQVRKLLFDLSEITLIGRRTADPDRFDRLDLQDPSIEGSNSVRLTLFSEDGSEVIDTVFGKTRENLAGSEPMLYLRQAAADQTYLAEGELELGDDAGSWMFRGVSDIPRADVAQAIFESTAGETLTFVKKENGRDFTLADMPEGREFDSQFSVNIIAGILEKLTFEDVRSAEGLTVDPSLGSAAVRLEDGTAIAIDLASADGETWMLLTVQATDDVTDAGRERADALRSGTDGWAFRLSDYVLSRFSETRESLLKPAEAS